MNFDWYTKTWSKRLLIQAVGDLSLQTMPPREKQAMDTRQNPSRHSLQVFPVFQPQAMGVSVCVESLSKNTEDC